MSEAYVLPFAPLLFLCEHVTAKIHMMANDVSAQRPLSKSQVNTHNAYGDPLRVGFALFCMRDLTEIWQHIVSFVRQGRQLCFF